MRYYYGQLTKPLQGVYDTLLSGFRVYAPSIRIPDVEQGQLAEVYLRLKLDEPLLFYVTGYRCRWMPGAAHLELLPEYLFDKSKILVRGIFPAPFQIVSDRAFEKSCLLWNNADSGAEITSGVIFNILTIQQNSSVAGII